MDKIKVLELIKTHLEGSDKFLVDLHISKDNRINIAIDGDNGVTIDDCVELSRFVEHSFDREEEDFELNVASAGIDSPLKLRRQYVKNVGRYINVTTDTDERVEGKLLEVLEKEIHIEPTNQPKKKNKENVEKEIVSIAFDEIKIAKIVVKF